MADIAFCSFDVCLYFFHEQKKNKKQEANLHFFCLFCFSFAHVLMHLFSSRNEAQKTTALILNDENKNA